MSIELDLSAIWQALVRDGQVRNVFVGADGKLIEAGLRIVGGDIQHYAIDRASNTEIDVRLFERRIPPSHFVVQFNRNRSLKPRARLLGLGRQPDYSAQAADCLFFCQEEANPLSILHRRAALKTTLANYQWTGLYNAVPLDSRGHFLWIPIASEADGRPFPHWPQTLTFPLFEDFLSLARSSKNALTLYNSLHAGASVNHIHFHSVYRDGPAAIDLAPTRPIGHRRLLADYPASGLAYSDAIAGRDIWSDVVKLQESGLPLNLVHTSQFTYVIARNIHHEVVAEFPDGILAGMELAGKVIAIDALFYKNADFATIKAALSKSTLRDEELLLALNS